MSLQIDSDQIINMPWDDLQAMLAEGLDAKAEVANSHAALKVCEKSRAYYRRAFMITTAIAAVLVLVIAILLGQIAVLQGWFR